MSRLARTRGHRDAIIIGAGMAGLRAAGVLAASGRSVTVIDKGRRHGGRMATRRVDDATFDTGAIAFAARSPAFRTAVANWAAEGHAHRFAIDGFATTATGHDSQQAVQPGLWRGAPMMRSLPTAIATAAGAAGDLEVRLATEVTGIDRDPLGWRVAASHLGASEVLTADALVMTPPAPQTRALLEGGPAIAAAGTIALLERVTYTPSLTVLVRPTDRTLSTLEAGDPTAFGPGTTAPDVLRVHHNETTGASPVIALTVQATRAASAAAIDEDRATAAMTLASQVAAVLGVALEVVHVHGWRYAHVVDGIDTGGGAPALLDSVAGAPLVLAGDLFVPASQRGPLGSEAHTEQGVERAFLSGDAAAGLLLDASTAP